MWELIDCNISLCNAQQNRIATKRYSNQRIAALRGLRKINVPPSGGKFFCYLVWIETGKNRSDHFRTSVLVIKTFTPKQFHKFKNLLSLNIKRKFK